MRTLALTALSLCLLIASVGCPPAPPKEEPAPPATGGESTEAPADPAASETPAGGPETPPQPIEFHLTPAEGGTELLESAKKLETYLEAETGLDFSVKVPQNYNALITSMEYGHTPFGALSPFPFVVAEKSAGARVLLKSVRASGPFYFSCIFALKKSGFTSIKDLEGKKMAFGDERSTAGTIIPKAGMITAGLDPATYFSETKNVGKHDAVVASVLNGESDAGATFCNTKEGDDGAWEQFYPDRADEFQVIWVSDPIPADTISVKDTYQDKYPQTVEKVKAALLKMNDNADGKQLLKDLYRIDGLMEAKSEDYDYVREAANLVDVPIE